MEAQMNQMADWVMADRQTQTPGRAPSQTLQGDQKSQGTPRTHTEGA